MLCVVSFQPVREGDSYTAAVASPGRATNARHGSSLGPQGAPLRQLSARRQLDGTFFEPLAAPQRKREPLTKEPATKEPAVAPAATGCLCDDSLQ